MTVPPRIAVLVACHDRRRKTLACLAALDAQTTDAALHPVVFDDGSRDGTAAAVRRLHPRAEILSGAGAAYWAGGMRAAFDHALRGDYDFYLWLNDDVTLAPDAVARLLAAHRAIVAAGHPLTLIGGAVADPATGRSAYGGIAQAGRWNPLRFRRRAPSATDPTPCATLNGNVVLVPRATARVLGSMGTAFVHTLGDLDYGLRARRAGAWVGLAPGHVGVCSPNSREDRWFNPALSLRARWRIVRQPLGFPLRPWLAFARTHGGPLWPVFAVLPFWRLVVPPAVIARGRNLIGRQSGAADGRSHAPLA